MLHNDTDAMECHLRRCLDSQYHCRKCATNYRNCPTHNWPTSSTSDGLSQIQGVYADASRPCPCMADTST
eukprot:5640542-Amphidinium_carterae.2